MILRLVRADTYSAMLDASISCKVRISWYSSGLCRNPAPCKLAAHCDPNASLSPSSSMLSSRPSHPCAEASPTSGQVGPASAAPARASTSGPPPPAVSIVCESEREVSREGAERQFNYCGTYAHKEQRRLRRAVAIQIRLVQSVKFLADALEMDTVTSGQRAKDGAQQKRLKKLTSSGVVGVA